jgi:DNA-directed RNA polymerase specialized sigma24 family protein
MWGFRLSPGCDPASGGVFELLGVVRALGIMIYSQEPDPVLWAAAAGGDAVAFGELYERHVQAVRAYLLRRTADPSVAEDLAQLAFLECWPVMAKQALQGDSARPFLLGVATNLLRRHWRSKRRHAEALRRLKAVDDRTVAGPEELALHRADALERVQAARAALSDLVTS